jgi:hypothetical protein
LFEDLRQFIYFEDLRQFIYFEDLRQFIYFDFLFSSTLNKPVNVTDVGTASPVYYYVNLAQAAKDSLLQGNHTLPSITNLAKPKLTLPNSN